MNFKVMPIGVRLFAADSPKATPTPKPAAAPTPAAKDPGNFYKTTTNKTKNLTNSTLTRGWSWSI